MLEELWASDYYHYKSLEYELRVYNADKVDKELERLKKEKEWLIHSLMFIYKNQMSPSGLEEKARKAIIADLQQALKEE